MLEMTYLRRLIFVGLLAAICVSCGDTEQSVMPVNSEPEFGFPPPWMDTVIVDTSLVSRAPFGNEEAEWMALYLSRDLMAPAAIYDRLVRDLERIREDYGDLVPPLTGEFRNYWSPGTISVGLTDEAAERYNAGAYTDLDELNELFRLDWISDAVFHITNGFRLFFAK